MTDTVPLKIVRWDPADEATTRGCYEVMLAAHAADKVIEPPGSYRLFGVMLREGWGRTPSEVWVGRAGHGTVAGYYKIGLPDLENTDQAFGGPLVDPSLRRRGLGRALLRHEGTRAQAHGRTRYAAIATIGSAGDAFARAVGAKPELEEVRRIQYLRSVKPEAVAALRSSAAAAAAGYSLVTWHGPIPDEYCAPMAAVFNAFNDSPRPAGDEPEAWDARRVRERENVYERLGVARSHSVGVMHDATGELAGYTEVTIDPEHPEWGNQQLTAVVRAHRGHRLGLLLKTAMLQILAAEEPGLERIGTSNAAANEHMIAINEQLGYRVVEPGWRFYEMPVSAVASV
jgi:GNAT superfamily N-acetyltransferase